MFSVEKRKYLCYTQSIQCERGSDMRGFVWRMGAWMLVICLILGIGMPAQAADKITHGTTDQVITADMVGNTPPSDYRINRATQADASQGLYNAYFLEDDLQEVRIEIPENNLNYLLQNAVDESYVMTTSVTIGDTTLGYCGLRTKGNYTLYHSYHDNPGSDRFSFTIHFGKYINKANYGQKQTFYGCEKISFNNFFFDKSMMKEYFAFKLMDEMGLPTPQYGLAKLYINGEYYGVYFMVEPMEDTVLEQHWGVDGKELSSYLCKPTGTNFSYDALLQDSAPLWEHDQETYADVEDMLPTVMEWVRKLNCLSKGTDFDGNKISVNSQEYVDLLSTILDLDEVLRYFATASWLCQMDNMFVNSQNYGLYVSADGVATLLPWDYDLAYGCYFPSTAETTANYPLDVMYMLNQWEWGDEEMRSKQFYKNYPLFHVIYQNQSLMAQYHMYMLECSQIVSLGGTLASTGKEYDPGYFQSCITAMEEALIAAATEKTASNVYYMNGIRQPADVTAALPNLAAILAQRSVGVYAQVVGLEGTVSGAGCDLATLGNAITGGFANDGDLITVHPGTGIFVQAKYRGGNRVAAPILLVSENGEAVAAAGEALGATAVDALAAYDLHISAVVRSDYTVTIPLTRELLAGEYSFYSYVDGELTALEVTQNGHLVSYTTKSLGTLVVLSRNAHVQSEKQDWVQWLIVGGLVLAGTAIVTVAVISEVRRRAAKRQ